jgi:hypothetical protein
MTSRRPIRKGSGKFEGLHLSAMYGRTDLERRSDSVKQSPSRIEELIFIRAIEMEVEFLGPGGSPVLDAQLYYTENYVKSTRYRSYILL